MRITLLTKCPVKYKLMYTRLRSKKDPKYGLPQDLAERVAKLRELAESVKPAEPTKTVEKKKGSSRRKARRMSRKKTHKRKY